MPGNTTWQSKQLGKEGEAMPGSREVRKYRRMPESDEQSEYMNVEYLHASLGTYLH